MPDALLRAFEKRIAWFAPGALLLYGVIALRVIVAKPLWHDEIYTIYLCRLPDMSAVWRALATGMEQMPPFAHVVSRTAYALAGGGAFAIRLPAAVGFAVMSACIYLFLAKRLPRPYALLGMLIPFFTGAAHFGYEGRSYGVVLGCAGIAMVAWQAAESRWRPMAVVMLALSAAAAVSSHYYAVLILFPLGIGEIVRSFERRRMDIAVWGALAASLVPLVFFLPLIRAARAFSSGYWAKPGPLSVADAYIHLVGIGLPVLTGLGILWLLYFVLVRERLPVASLDGLGPDLAVAAGFLALPVVLLGPAILTHAYESRYAIWAVLGLALGVAYAGYLGTAGSRSFGTVAAVFLLVCFAGIQFFELHRAGNRKPEALAPLEHLAGSSLPIVYADPVGYLQAAYYAPANLTRRLFHLADPEAALRRAGTDTPERALQLLARIAPLRLASVREFAQSNPNFLVIDSGEISWLMPELVPQSRVTLREVDGDYRIYEVLFARTPATQASARAARLPVDSNYSRASSWSKCASAAPSICL